MKKLFIAVVLALASTAVFAEAETKKVCKDKTDKAGKVLFDKAGKPQQDCKTIKIHQKLEGTKVEDAKKK
jgi:hypothetical protein